LKKNGGGGSRKAGETWKEVTALAQNWESWRCFVEALCSGESKRNWLIDTCGYSKWAILHDFRLKYCINIWLEAFSATECNKIFSGLHHSGIVEAERTTETLDCSSIFTRLTPKKILLHCVNSFPHILHVPPLSSSWYYYPNSIWWIVRIKELFTMRSRVTSCRFGRNKLFSSPLMRLSLCSTHRERGANLHTH
jgi:hypothetical protein